MKLNKLAVLLLIGGMVFASTANAAPGDRQAPGGIIDQVISPDARNYGNVTPQSQMPIVQNPQATVMPQAAPAPDIYADYYNKLGALRQAIINKHMELEAVLNSPQPDNGRIESISRDIGILQGKILSARAALQAQMQKQGVSPEILGLNPQELPDQGPSPKGPYNWGGPRHFHQSPHARGDHYRQGYGPGYNGNYYGPGAGSWGCMGGPCWQ